MKELEFRRWMEQQGYRAETINSRVSNCLRVCEHEGDLEIHYQTDKCQFLLERLTYTTADERDNSCPKHNIQINGNIRNGTATLKQAVNLYLKFRNGSNAISILSTPEVSAKIPEKPQSSYSISTLDSYAIFLDYFGIDKDAFYLFGLENTLFAELSIAEKQWKETLDKLLNNKPLAIRGYGRQGKNTKIYFELYKYIFHNNKIYEDPTNNEIPRKNLQIATNYKINTTLFNYQCSHIFGHTKNPLLFESVWNICFTPKIFDPLTGHETTGTWPLEYQKKFKTMVNLRFNSFIAEYNSFVVSHQIGDKVKQFIETVNMKYENRLIKKFTLDALSEWSIIDTGGGDYHAD